MRVYDNQVLGIIGESGSGKTTVARIMAGLHVPISGSISVNGKDSTPIPARDKIQFIHQDAADALDPSMCIADIVAEGLLDVPKQQKITLVTEALNLAGLDNTSLTRLPHHLSGGQRQRVCIARAIVTKPRLIIADEPISALDLTLQLQIIDLLKDLKSKLKFACVFVSHDMSVIAELADYVCVLKNGEIVESGNNISVFKSPQHPYTKALLNASNRIAKVSENSYEKENWL
jgi:ABC-type dipeptide/oligopeptide/nickel transport system ATPase subunit